MYLPSLWGEEREEIRGRECLGTLGELNGSHNRKLELAQDVSFGEERLILGHIL